MDWTTTGLVLAIASAALLLAGPLGTRAGLWPYVAGFALVAISVLLALSALVLSSIGTYTASRWVPAAAGIAVALFVVGALLRFIISASGAPAIHDITTDTDDPPELRAVLPLRRNAANPPEYGGAAIAERQRRAYPDIQPLELPLPASEAFARSLAAARALGWEIVASDQQAGRIEAVDTTYWFGFQDDVVIRVRETGAGSRVDVRSKSRVGVGDAGTNARRIRKFVDAVRGG